MELTIDQALQQGIEAHKAGQVQEADRLYTAILKAQPKHPDANHNMGVLAVGVGKVEEALPFFKTALEANPNTDQFWLSYIAALIKLDRLADAKAVLDQATSSGAEGDGFDKLAQRLDQTSKVQDPPEDQQQALIKLYNQGQLQQAIEQVPQMLKQFPNSAFVRNIQGAVLHRLGQLELSIEAYKKALTIKPGYAEASMNIGTVLQEQGKLEEAINAYRNALSIRPNYSEAHLNIANALTKQDKLEEAINGYRKAIDIKPDYADAYSNMGVTLKKQGKLEEAINSYRKAIDIKPDFANPYNNIGNVLRDQGKLKEAILAYNNALAIRPDYAEAYSNIGNALRDQGKLVEAIEAYNKALTIKPDFTECFVTLNYLKIQISNSDSTTIRSCKSRNNTLDEILSLNPKYQIQQSIKNFILGKLRLSEKYLQKYRKLIQTKGFDGLRQKDKNFCASYYIFLTALIENNTTSHQTGLPLIYHIGESHCLSYAHHNVYIDKKPYTFRPKMVFGAKAFHFSSQFENSYKAITANHLKKIPNGSTVFISIGEIDCRPDEGIIQASDKTGKTLNKIIDDTIDGYIGWFLNQNISNQHNYYFFNVPAPMYDQQYSKGINNKVAEVVALFNANILKKASSSQTNIIDVYRHTVNKKGFSNGRYHCDKCHLDNRIIPLIENNLSA